jgi:hypothetical protein
VAQELFGEPKPAPELFWPPEAEMAARRAMISDALPAMALVVAAAAPALATDSLRASAPILADAPMNLIRARRASFAFGIGALLIVGVAGLALGYAFWGAISASPRTATVSAQIASAGFSPEKAPASVVPLGHAGLAAQTPVTPVRFGDTGEASEQLPSATPPLGGTPLTVAEATPTLPPEVTGPSATAEPISAAGAKPRKQSEILQKKKCAVIKTVSSHTGRGKSSLHGGKRNPANPLVIVGRAVNSFTARIAKDLRRIPVRLSSLMTGH